MKISFKKILLSCITMILTITACAGTDTARWTEEVRSWDGSVFQLEGRGEIGSNGWPTEHRGRPRYIEYYHRPTQAYWRSQGGAYFPNIFDLVNGIPYVVILVYDVTSCFLNNYPEEGLLIYKWDSSKGWQSAKASELPAKFEFNLMEQMFDTRDKKDDVKGFVPLSIKAIREGGDRVGDFAKWKKEYGSYCKKQKERGVKVNTNAKAANFIGFHGQHNF